MGDITLPSEFPFNFPHLRPVTSAQVTENRPSKDGKTRALSKLCARLLKTIVKANQIGRGRCQALKRVLLNGRAASQF